MSDTRAHTPSDDDHSNLVGGSTAGRRLACPGSYQKEQELPAEIKKESSVYADEGTALHECIAHILENDILDIDSLIGSEFYGFEMTKKLLAEAIVPAVDFFDQLVDACDDEGGLAFVTEKKCQMPGIPGAFGTSDIIGRTDKRSIIVDWKFGAGVPVYASKVEEWSEDGKPIRETGNPQLMFYARAAMFTHPELFEENPDWPVDLYICQPRIADSMGKTHSHYRTTVKELEEFRFELIKAIAEAKGDNPRIRLGDHCRFARCKVICPLHTAPVLDLSKMVVADKLSLDHTDTLSDTEYGDLLSTIMDLGAALAPYVAEAEKQARVMLDDGLPVGHWKLVPKKAGHDKWVDEDKADAYLGRQGLSVGVRRVVKPVTPAVARKLLKQIDKELNEKYVASGQSSGTNLAPGDDHRQAVQSNSAMAAALADKLAALTGQ